MELTGDGVLLKGWWFRGEGRKRGTIVYLHGVGDNRGSSLGIAAHFVPKGFDVIAYDSRAHGESQGDACTYGYYERKDLSRVLDKVDASRSCCSGPLSAPPSLSSIHGDRDEETPSAHSMRIFAALREPKRLILVPNRGHHDSLTPEVWRDIDGWLEGILTPDNRR